ncbi:MAG: ATP-binding protein [Pseudomonadota bacterium]
MKKATNPCPCGYAHDTHKECSCSPNLISRYLNKISGPLHDRIDLHLSVPRPGANILAGGGEPSETSAAICRRVEQARDIQAQRGMLNRDLSANELNRDNLVKPEARALLLEVAERKALSARSWFRALRVARTVADLGGRARVNETHVAEALTLRMIDLN